MMYLARKGINDFQVIPETEDDPTPQLTRFVNKGYTLYSVQPVGNGDVLLKIQNVGVSSVTTQIYESVVLEDAN